MGATPVFKQPEVKKTMDFAGAAAKILMGEKVQRLAWPNKNVCLFMRDDRLLIRTAEGLTTDVLINRADMEALDWVVVEPTVQ